jgi:hypothetical protein
MTNCVHFEAKYEVFYAKTANLINTKWLCWSIFMKFNLYLMKMHLIVGIMHKALHIVCSLLLIVNGVCKIL